MTKSLDDYFSDPGTTSPPADHAPDPDYLVECSLHAIAAIPEQPSLGLVSTGPMGGDGGHGGNTALVVKMEGCSLLHVIVRDEAGNVVYEGDQNSEVTVTVCGDWEGRGMANGIVDLAGQLVREKAAAGATA